MEEEQSGSKRKPPSCSRCSNHGKDAPLTHHKCPYEECDCLLCKLTWARKIVMRKQQQLWRHRKETQKWEEAAAESVGGGGGGGTGGGEGETEEGGGKQREKYCDMCRNHGVLVRNRGHKRSCKYENCPCDLCSFTRKRRQIMQLQQKVKRSKITTQQFQEATEWVAKLTAELANLGIDDVPMSTLVTPMAPTSNLPPPHGSFPPPQGPPPPGPPVEGGYPSNLPPGLYPPAQHPLESYPPPHQPPSCSRMATRPFMAVTPVSAAEHYPSTSYAMDPGPSCSSPSTACAVAGTVSGVPPSYGGMSSANIHLPMDSSTSFAALCPPSPSYTSLSASPLSDYDPSYPGCPSPLLSYLSADNPNREMTSIPQQSCAMISNAQSSEPLDCSDHPIHSSRSHKHAHNRLQEHIENPSMYSNRSLYSNPQSTHRGWPTEPRNVEEITPETYWAGQRRRSEGVILPTYQHSQRRNSDSILQGIIYRPSQRRNSDGVIKKFYGQSQRGNNDPVIQEGYMQEDRGAGEGEPQKHFKADLRESSEGVIEEGHEAEDRIRSIYHLDQRRNSDGVILTRHRLNERRNSDGVIKKCFALSQRGNFDRLTQRHVMHPMEKSDEELHSIHRENERRSSDEISQESYGIEHRRNSIDFVHENYRLGERRNSDDALRAFYWPCHRSDSGETIPENWQGQRRDSDEYIQRSFPSNKDHFFENTLRREHEVMERLNRTVPITDASVTFSSDHRLHYPIRPPVNEDECQQATGIRKDGTIPRVDDSDTMMSWSSHQIHDEGPVPPLEQNDEEMEGPLDLTTRSSSRD
ncbi:uncharacterized protein LOC135219351 isoform X1 [Macrobrachium nipponense]|uniref:uncharacterized protein LOC135219351 isoform X1 n=2 Tax=Macrobrachium nipponense TaxID=159736 RepID=UPI0030C816A6